MDEDPQAALEERYEIRSKIGEGGIGAVYRAYDRSLKREVAIKRLLPQGDKPEEERYNAEEIVREAGLLSKLQHPNIVTVYDAGIDSDGGYVVMELIDGETVDETLERGALTFRDFRQVVEESLEGLIAAQDIDMLHRDLKPSNVMIRWLPSGKFQLKLLDFGLARVTQKPALQTVRHGDAILGSIYFMAPEQFEREPLDGRTDLYSLGCLFYYMLAGAYPFDGETGADVMVKKLEHDVRRLSDLRPDIPPQVCDWVMRLMARHIPERPADAKEALREFEVAAEAGAKQLEAQDRNPLLAPALAAGRPLTATHATAPQAGTASRPVTGVVPTHTTSYYMRRPPGSKSGNAGLAFASAAAVLLSAAAAVGGWWFFTQKKASKPKPAAEQVEADTEEPMTKDPSPPPVTKDPVPPTVDEPEVAEQPWPDSSKLTPLVLLGSVWEYWDRGGVPPSEWRQLEYPAVDWSQGPAPLGYGEKEGVLETEIDFGGDEKNKHICYLFRHPFTAPENRNFTALWLRYQVDDGCFIYLNGKEISRLGMEEDRKWPGPRQLAIRTAREGRDESRFHPFRIERQVARLKPGENVLAVRVHQTSKSSSDVRFDLELYGER